MLSINQEIMNKYLEATLLILSIYITVGILVVVSYGLGGSGEDLLSQHYRSVINLILA